MMRRKRTGPTRLERLLTAVQGAQVEDFIPAAIIVLILAALCTALVCKQ